MLLAVLHIAPATLAGEVDEAGFVIGSGRTRKASDGKADVSARTRNPASGHRHRHLTRHRAFAFDQFGG